MRGFIPIVIGIWIAMFICGMFTTAYLCSGKMLAAIIGFVFYLIGSGLLLYSILYFDKSLKSKNNEN